MEKSKSKQSDKREKWRLDHFNHFSFPLLKIFSTDASRQGNRIVHAGHESLEQLKQPPRGSFFPAEPDVFPRCQCNVD